MRLHQKDARACRSSTPRTFPTMTMDIAKEEVEYISLALKTNPVTYHSVSRELGVHVTQSKRLLYSYYQASKDSVNASFIATGTREGNLQVKILHSEEDAKDAGRYFDELHCVHVYCLTLAQNTFSDNEIALSEMKHGVDFSKIELYYRLGVIRGPELKAPEFKAPVGSEKIADVPVTREQPKKEVAPKKTLEYTSRKEQPTPSLLSKYVSRKGEKRPGDADTPKSASKPAYQYKSRKLERNQPKERVVISQEEPDNDMDMDLEPAAAPQAAPKSDLNSLFLDDLSDFNDDDDMNIDQQDQPIVVENDAEPEKVEERIAAPQVPEDSVFRSLTSKSTTPISDAAAAPEPEIPETTVDEDGYITTYKAKPAAKPASRPAPKPSAPSKTGTNTKKKGDGKMKQASLMSFFGKR